MIKKMTIGDWRFNVVELKKTTSRDRFFLCETPFEDSAKLCGLIVYFSFFLPQSGTKKTHRVSQRFFIF